MIKVRSLKFSVAVFSLIVIGGIVLFANQTLKGKGFVHVNGKEIVNASEKPVALRGIGLGMWLVPEGYMFKFGENHDSPAEILKLTDDLLGKENSEKFWTAYRDNFITEKDIKAIKDFGFNSIRIPMHYKLLSPKRGTYLKSGFEYIDRVVKWSKNQGIWVVLDMHCAPGGQTGTNIDDSPGYPGLWDSDTHKKHTIEIWAELAKRYKDNTTIIGYDLLNEPIAPEFSSYTWMLEGFYRDITKAIRKADKNHIIFLEGANWANNWSVFLEPSDKNTVYSFHKYWDRTDTNSILTYIAWRKAYNVPIWLGETGENSTEWYQGMVALMKKNNIGWAFWPWKKIGSDNCPYSIMPPDGWEEITAYSNGGEKPSRKRAQAIFDELLENVKFENCNENPLVRYALGD